MDSHQIFFRMLNPLTRLVLKSPLHRLISSKILVLIFPGRVSGKIYSIPLSYLKSNDKELFCITDKEYMWWKNLKSCNSIQVLFEGKMHNANITVESENINLIGDRLKAMCLHDKAHAYFAEVGFKDKMPIEEDIVASASRSVLLQLSIA
ncbi:MAG: hypothetical protein CMO98_08260 [Woeseia sp.]|mgnify:FL=1|nr:hypothetical protein [Woeseia sp.]